MSQSDIAAYNKNMREWFYCMLAIILGCVVLFVWSIVMLMTRISLVLGDFGDMFFVAGAVLSAITGGGMYFFRRDTMLKHPLKSE